MRYKTFTFIFFVMLLSLIVACSSSGSTGITQGGDSDSEQPAADGDDIGYRCNGNDDCDDGYYCDAGVCREADCIDDSTCPTGYHCDNYICLKDATVDDGDVDTVTDGDNDLTEDEGEQELDEERPVICTPGDYMCIGDMLGVCNEDGTDWVDLELCPQGQVCIVDACVASACEPDEWGDCINDVMIYRCNSFGTGWEETPCPSNQHCEEGACIPIECTPDEPIECVDEATLKRCNADGNDWITEDCPEDQVCRGAECAMIICEPGDWQCNENNVLFYCNGYGTGWDEIMDCEESGAVCDDGTCLQRICEPSVLSCDETDVGLVKQCNENGTAWEEVQTCEGESQCRNGECMTQCDLAAFDRSYVGCDYWTADLNNRERIDAGVLGFVIGNPQQEPVTVEIFGNTGSLQSGTVEPGVVREFTFGSTRLITGPGITNKAYHIHSSLPVIVTMMNPNDNATQIFSNDATLLIPQGALGKEYYVTAWPTNRGEACGCSGIVIAGECIFGSWSCDGFSESGFVTVVASEPGQTQVTVHYSAQTVGGGNVTAAGPGTTRSYTLNQFDVLNFESGPGDCPDVDADVVLHCYGPDLSGTKVDADKKVAVFGGHECTYIPNGVPYCDHLEHQIFPVDTWGKQFIAVRPEPRGSEVAVYKIVASEDGTRITLDPDPTGHSPANLNAGDVWDFSTERDFHVSSDKPVSVAQYFVGHEGTGTPDVNRGGDPAMLILAPDEQFRKDYIFLVPGNYVYNYLTIVAPNDTEIVIDDTTTYQSSTFTVVNADFRRKRISIGDGPHTLRADKPVGLYVYGYAQDVSYAYVAGLDLKEINPKP